MDALAIIKKIDENRKKIEKLDSKASTSHMSNIGTFISIVIGLYAAYLSYECNSKKNMPEMTKIIFAMFAYIFGLFYLVYFYLFQYDRCNDL